MEFTAGSILQTPKPAIDNAGVSEAIVGDAGYACVYAGPRPALTYAATVHYLTWPYPRFPARICRGASGHAEQ